MATVQSQREGVKLLADEEYAHNLLTIIDQLERPDIPVRERMVRQWKKQNLYWDHIQYVYWSEFAHDWRTPDQLVNEPTDEQLEVDPATYAKVINIYRAHGEIIIAAMGASLPQVRYFPDDADNAEDVQTAKAYSRIAELIQKHNQAPLLFLKALYILYNQGLVCAYNENRQDEKFGTVQTPEMVDVPYKIRDEYCPQCGMHFGQENLGPVPDEEEEGSVRPANEMMGDGEMPMDPTQMMDMSPQMRKCPSCGSEVEPETEESTEVFEEIVGYNDTPKARECIELYGPLNVKVPHWVTRQEDTPYLILETEEHYTYVQSIYPELADKIGPGAGIGDINRDARASRHYSGDLNRDLVTVRRCWLRPWAYFMLGVGEENAPKRAELESKFPDGCYVVIVNSDQSGNGLVAEAVADKLDDHWTLTHHPLSTHLHAEPLGAPVMPVQDMTNELANLTLENIEFSIPELFADPTALDFEKYKKSEARPGMVYPAKTPLGGALGNAFHEVKGGTLSREVELFADRLEKFAQFVAGSLPSVYGGALDGGSGTAREYEMSRTQALQRLSIAWTLVKVWWSQLMSKSVRSFAQNMVTDEKYVKKNGSSFINVWIKKAQLSGKVGDIEPEINEALPVSWSQKRDVILNLMQQGNPAVMEVIGHSENASMIAGFIGVPELYIPGDDSRNKQLMEIAKLILDGEPIEEEPQMPPPGMDGAPNPDMQAPDGAMSPQPMAPPQPTIRSTVPIDPELDDHQVEAETTKAWLISELGQDMKETNPGAYANVLAHYKEHKFELDKAEAQMAAKVPPPPGPPSEGKEE